MWENFRLFNVTIVVVVLKVVFLKFNGISGLWFALRTLNNGTKYKQHDKKPCIKLAKRTKSEIQKAMFLTFWSRNFKFKF